MIMFGKQAMYGTDDYLLSKVFMLYLNKALNFMTPGDHDFFDSPAKLIASVELLILIGLWIRALWAVGYIIGINVPMLSFIDRMIGMEICIWNARKKRLRWYATQRLFFNLIPMIGV